MLGPQPVQLRVEAVVGQTDSSRLTTLSMGNWVAILVGLDAVLATLGSGLGVLSRFGEGSTQVEGIPYVVIAGLLPGLWVATMALGGAYDRRCVTAGPEEFRRIANASVWFLGVVAFTSFAFHADVSRKFVAVTLPLASFLTLVGRLCARRALRRRLATGNTIHRVVAVGTARENEQLIRHMQRNRHVGFAVVGALSAVEPGALETSLEGEGVSGEPEDLVRRAIELGADTIAVAGSSSLGPDELRRLSWALEGSGICLLVVPNVAEIAGPRIAVRPVEGLPLLEIEEPVFSGVRRVFKTAFDKVGSAFLLVLSSPLLLVLGLAIKLNDRGPVFFRQVRIGKDGETFRIWKFRTMRLDADEHYAELVAQAGHAGILFKLQDDPRVTRLGSRLRRFSLDELPQLFNVLTGSMSLVGPRPQRMSEVEQYSSAARRRLKVKPGMTGLWQVSGRSRLPWNEAVQLDLYYVENWSIWMDFAVLLRTVRAVIASSGAY